MINILVVDDEPISADGISIYLEEHGDSTWNVLTAYNSESAMKFSQQRIDILLTDIMMPGTDGFGLQEQIRQRWPMVKTVFLTGNRQLDFAQQAIRSSGVVDYVLKMEDETVVLQAVRKAVAAMEDDARTRDALQRAEQDVRRMRPLVQKDLLSSIVKGSSVDHELSNERFEQIGLKLRADAPVLLVVGQLGEGVNGGHMTDLAFCALDNILEQYIWPIYRYFSVRVSDRRVVMFLQLGNGLGRMDVHHAFSLLELAQQAFTRAMCPAVLVVNHTECDWQHVSQHYRSMLLTLEQSLGVTEDTLILQNENQQLPETMHANELFQVRSLLERGAYEQAAAACKNIVPPQSATGRITLYRQLLKIFSIVVDARPDAQQIYQVCRIPALQISDKGWRETQADFALMFRSLMGAARSPSQRKEELVDKICTYVKEHLSEDLSLTRIAEMMYHSSTYISKLFAETKGVNYNNYVVSKRLAHAAQLLSSTRLTLNEIVEQVGYRSSSYFIHAFRAQYGVTPAEYRKTWHKG